MPAGPSPAAGHFLLNLDDRPVLLEDFDGGNIRGNVVTTNMGPQQLARKNISTLTFEPFRLGVGMSMGKPLIDWIKTSLDLSAMRKDGSVVTVNTSDKAQWYRHFRGALIEEITIPAMDATSKEAAPFTIKFQAEKITYAKGDGAVVKAPADTKPKKWLTSNFRLRIGALPCKRLAKIDAFTIKQSVERPARLEFPNLKVTFSAADAGAWEDWFQAFVIDGNNGQEKELKGAIEFLDPSTNGILGSIELSQVGIFSLHEEKQDASNEGIARYVAQLYVEKMSIDIQNV